MICIGSSHPLKFINSSSAKQLQPTIYFSHVITCMSFAVRLVTPFTSLRVIRFTHLHAMGNILLPVMFSKTARMGRLKVVFCVLAIFPRKWGNPIPISNPHKSYSPPICSVTFDPTTDCSPINPIPNKIRVAGSPPGSINSRRVS